MDCVPPVLSKKNRCTGKIINKTVCDYLYTKFYEMYLSPLSQYKPNAAQRKCLQPCQIMENHVHLVGSSPIQNGYKEAPSITLRFSETVQVKTKVSFFILQKYVQCIFSKIIVHWMFIFFYDTLILFIITSYKEDLW